MKTTRIFALFAALAMAGLTGCPSNNNNVPPGTDGGPQPDMGPVLHDGGNDTGPVAEDGGTDTGPVPDDTGTDGGPDAGPCTSTMTHCNTCVTATTDPFNACSAQTGSCIPFDNTRVPGWPDHIPAVH